MTNPMTWLQEVRKLDGALLALMKVGEVQHPNLSNAIQFPYLKDGKPYAAKFRTIGKKFSSSRGINRELYNKDALSTDADKPVVITEGEIDCLTVIQSGYLRSVSLPDGWNATGNKLDCLLAAEKDLRASPFVIVAGDTDEAGESLPRTVANLLKGHDVRYVTWPEGCKDANDVLMLFGEGKVSECLVAAKTIDPEGGFITSLSDLPPMSARRVLRSGNSLVDGRLAFELGAMSIGTGMPGSGKTTLITWAMHLITKHEKIRCGFMLFETHAHRTRDHLARLETGQAFDTLSTSSRAELLKDLDERFRIVHRTFTSDQDHHLGWLESMVHTLAVRDGCKIIVVDPWNELEHFPNPGEKLTDYINFAIKRIRQIAEQLEIHICVIAHPKKMESGREPRPPLGYDVADSAAFANKPALGFTVHPAKTETGAQFVELITWKVRDVQLYGFWKGTSSAAFNAEQMSYEHIDLGQKNE